MEGVMVELKTRTRATGATGLMARHGPARLVSETGGTLDVTTSVSDPGFNPLDLLYASLAACLVLSVKGAVNRLQFAERFIDVSARVTGEKAHEGPSRVETIFARLTITGDFTDQERDEIARLAKELCTVSNTLALTPSIEVTVEGV
jgi:uncharacterized OsmC-like protein